MTEKELKFHADLSQLIQRAFRAGASLDSVQLVMYKIQSDLASFEPYLKAMSEKDLGP